MPIHIVRRGECVESIAYAHGLAWETVWAHKKNAPLRDLGREPTQLVPGDELFVPELTLRSCKAGTDARHRFRLKGIPSRLELRFLDEGGEPREAAYELDLGGKITTGTLRDGWLEVWVMPDVEQGSVKIERAVHEELLTQDEEDLGDEFDDQSGDQTQTEGGDTGVNEQREEGEEGEEGVQWEHHELRLGHLEPSHTVAGAQARLANLGLYPGSIDGELGAALELAILHFQVERELEPTGLLDETTYSALAEVATP